MWQLCARAAAQGFDVDRDCFAVFVSNKANTVAWFLQALANPPQSAVCWDYHVVFVQRCAATGEPFVFDFDSVLPFPCRARDYFPCSARPDVTAGSVYLASFRLLTARAMLDCFASDRRHMRDAAGRYSKPPPATPPIATPRSAHNLDCFVDLAHTRFKLKLAAAATAANTGAISAGATAGSMSNGTCVRADGAIGSAGAASPNAAGAGAGAGAAAVGVVIDAGRGPRYFGDGDDAAADVVPSHAHGHGHGPSAVDGKGEAAVDADTDVSADAAASSAGNSPGASTTEPDYNSHSHSHMAAGTGGRQREGGLGSDSAFVSTATASPASLTPASVDTAADAAAAEAGAEAGAEAESSLAAVLAAAAEPYGTTVDWRCLFAIFHCG